MAKYCVIALLLIGLVAGTAGAAKAPPALTMQSVSIDVYGTPPKDPDPLFEGFERSTFPPAGWSLSGTNGLWGRSTACSGYGSGAASVRANFYSANVGVNQTLISVTTTPTAAGDSLQFEHAYATYGGERDSLAIYTSINDGANWVLLVGLGGGASGPLNTGGTTEATFVPSAGQWATKKYALPVGTNKIEFKAISAYGNQLYIDNILVPQPHDVGAKGSNVPAFTIDGTLITPQLTVKNYGRNAETFMAFCRIEQAEAGGTTTPIAFDSMTVSSLNPNTTTSVAFPSFTAVADEAFFATFYTVLAGDMLSINDTTRSAVRVYTSPKKPLGELTTSTTCGPCVSANASLGTIYNTMSDQISLIRYHCWWPAPGNDPYVTAESRNRVNYYGADYAPHLRINGTYDAGSTGSNYQGYFNSQITSNFAPFTMTMSGTYDSIANQGWVHTEITATGRIVDPIKVRYAIVEDSVYYTGPNGDPRHDQLFRKMLPDTLGQAIVIDRGDVMSDSQAFTIGASWRKRLCHIVAFAQTDIENEAQKTVFQSENISLMSILVSGVAGTPIQVPTMRTVLMPVTPNPVAGKARFVYSLAAAGCVKLGVYDITGRLVARVVDGNVPAGDHSVTWNGTNHNGQSIASGVYFVRLEADGVVQTQRVTVIR